MLSKLKISGRVLVLGVVPLVVLAGVLVGSFWSAQVKDRLFNRLYEQHLVILSDVMTVQQILQQGALQEIRKYRTGWASAATTEETVTGQLELARQHWESFVSSRPQKENGSEYYAELDQAFSRAVKHYQEWISYAGTDALLVKILNESTVNNETELRITGFAELAQQFIQQQIATAADVRDEAAAFTGQLAMVYLAGGGILLLLVSAMVWLIQRSVCRPLWTLRDMLQQVASESDLSLRVNVSGRDEVAEAAVALNQMLEHFEALVVRLGSRAGALNHQAGQVADFSEHIKQHTSQQSSQAGQLASVAEQMSVSVNEVAENARHAATAAGQAEQLCTTGRHIAADSVRSITQLVAELNSSSLVINQLQQDTGQISGVLEVISKIAEQTNLLALNAAIEAARAGEAGRGFSVVADEVRNLSENTRQATASIHGMITQLQQQAISAVQVMAQANSRADSTVELAQQTGVRFEELAAAVEQMAQANLHISKATTQQQRAAAEVAGSIQLLDSDINQLTAGASDSATASEQLKILATQLDEDWQVFQTVRYA